MKKKITFIFLIVCFPYYLTAQTHSHQKDSLNNIPDSTSVRMPVRPVPFYSENKDYREIPLFTGKEHEEEYYRKYEPLLIPEYFLLGTMNGVSYRKSEGYLNSYEDSEEPLVEYLNSFIQEKFNIHITIEKDKNNQIHILSKELIELLDTYIVGDKLKENLFNSPEERNSFLLGSYYRFGKKNKNSYTILPSWLSIERLFLLLVKSGAQESVSYHWYTYSIPGNSAFIFQPSFVFEKYIQLIDAEKNKLDVKKYQKR